jgi:hypothetical protein
VARGLGVEVETLLEGTDGEVPKAAPPSAEAEKVRLGNVASEATAETVVGPTLDEAA